MSGTDRVDAFSSVMVSVNDFALASKQFGQPMTELANLVKRAFELEFQFIQVCVKIPEPNEANLNNLLQPISEVIERIQAFRDRNRHVEEFFNHLSTVSESIVAISWISVKQAPVQFVRDMRDAGEYFGNRVLATNKGQSFHINWINKWNEVLKNLEQYVRAYHLTGFEWKGASNKTDMLDKHFPPPPPPPVPTKLFAADDLPGGDDRTALLNQLNQGLDITRMLRPTRHSGEAAVPAQFTVQAATAPSKAASTMRTYPPKFFLDGRKWRVEHQKDNFSMNIKPNDMSESLAMFKCENSGLEVTNKINGATLDNCKRVNISLNDIISSVEVIRCERLKIQCNGHVPLISLDNCDSVQIFTTDKSRNVEIISSKSTSCNVCFLAPDGDYSEEAIPEQIKTVIVGLKLKSSVVEKN